MRNQQDFVVLCMVLFGPLNNRNNPQSVTTRVKSLVVHLWPLYIYMWRIAETVLHGSFIRISGPLCRESGGFLTRRLNKQLKKESSHRGFGTVSRTCSAVLGTNYINYHTPHPLRRIKRRCDGYEDDIYDDKWNWTIIKRDNERVSTYTTTFYNNQR